MKITTCITVLLGLVAFLPIDGFAQVDTHTGNRFVLVLDIQQHFTADMQPDSSANNLIQAINTVIDQSNPDRVLYVKSTIKALNISIKGLSVDRLPKLQFDKRLRMVSMNIFEKDRADAFSSTELVQFLKNNNVKEIAVVGLMAEQCILKTALGGKKRGYTMLVIPEAIIGKTLMSKEKIINRLVKNGIGVLPIGEVSKTR